MVRFMSSLGLLALTVACGTSSSGGTTGGGSMPTFNINNKTLAPTTLTVPAGSTVAFVNHDSIPHTATSEAVPGAFSPAAGADGGFAFDTDEIAGGATATITIPSTAKSGTVQPFYCKIHENMMTPANPTIIIQ